ncbi:putative gamma-tubulin complex component 5 [Trichinella spiralis]|uniref:putative gamma-tubulin complex component 5 n=1 Tax=Trichinella spiralis TaxID=6334 RepID=UPI0001EFE390|nr:putative gamma-tubulin complex component 5 [Trichinella spiralis]
MGTLLKNSSNYENDTFVIFSESAFMKEVVFCLCGFANRLNDFDISVISNWHSNEGTLNVQYLKSYINSVVDVYNEMKSVRTFCDQKHHSLQSYDEIDLFLRDVDSGKYSTIIDHGSLPENVCDAFSLPTLKHLKAQFIIAAESRIILKRIFGTSYMHFISSNDHFTAIPLFAPGLLMDNVGLVNFISTDKNEDLSFDEAKCCTDEKLCLKKRCVGYVDIIEKRCHLSGSLLMNVLKENFHLAELLHLFKDIITLNVLSNFMEEAFHIIRKQVDWWQEEFYLDVVLKESVQLKYPTLFSKLSLLIDVDALDDVDPIGAMKVSIDIDWPLQNIINVEHLNCISDCFICFLRFAKAVEDLSYLGFRPSDVANPLVKNRLMITRFKSKMLIMAFWSLMLYKFNSIYSVDSIVKQGDIFLAKENFEKFIQQLRVFSMKNNAGTNILSKITLKMTHVVNLIASSWTKQTSSSYQLVLLDCNNILQKENNLYALYDNLFYPLQS